MRKLAISAIVLFWAACVNPSHAASTTEPANASLDAARLWLAANPPNGHNAAERRQRMAVIQAAADQLSPDQFKRFASACTTQPAVADEMQQSGILYYLKQATDSAIADIHRTTVKRGVAVWHIYNIGYVFKTPTACFGIDLRPRDGQRLARDLDFLLVTHAHDDHISNELMDAMISAGKPVVTSWYPGSRTIPIGKPTTQPTEFRFGDVRVKVDIGDHHYNDRKQRDNMLMYQIDCGPAANDCTIYHSGDNSNLSKMKPDRPVDVLVFHLSVGLPVERTIRTINPKMALVSHVLELRHSPKRPTADRWSYNFAFNTFRNISESQATVLTWGERWLTPGTELSQ